MWGGIFFQRSLSMRYGKARRGTVRPDSMRRLYISQSLSAKIRDDDGKVFERLGKGSS